MSRPYADQDAFRAIADPTRRRIIQLLRDRERSVGDLAAEFECSLSTFSLHLGVLRSLGIVTQRRVGTRRLCTVHARALKPIARFLTSVEEKKKRASSRA